MIVGIDVGGTNTDVAYIDEDGNLQTFKYPNEYGITRILSDVGERVDLRRSRLVISTSLPLNILTSQFDRVKVLSLVFPGPGLNYENYGVVLKGYVNHRGDVVEDIDPAEVEMALKSREFDAVAISGKFSVRNPELEHRALEVVRRYVGEESVALSHHVGHINFPLRINTTIINAKISREVWDLTNSIRRFTEDFFYYKGDGGIIPWRVAMRNPSELYNSSPASVAYGARYLTGEGNAIIVDIGGTTTDILLLRNGAPEVEEKVRIQGMKTHVRCVRSVSIPFGGDSLYSGELKPYRLDKPLAFGGKYATLTDLLNVVGEEIGDHRRSRDALNESAAEREVEAYTDRVAEVVSGVDSDLIIGTGYLARYLIPKIAEKSGKRYVIPMHHESANAVGVAVSRVSLTLYARFDTERRVAIFNGELDSEQIERISGHPDDEELISMAVERARELAVEYGAHERDVRDVDVVYFNSFSIVRGGIKRGKIADVVVQIRPGLCCDAV
ncbi:hydantoinase/oxoprolinase family protein [Geoglobus ahangari]